MVNLNLNKVKFSNNDLNRKIKIPNKLTLELAELIGIIIGDGNLYTKDRFELTIIGNITEDKEYHEKVTKLFKKLFNISTKSEEKYFKNGTCRRIRIKSKAIISFLIKIIGLKSGRKQEVDIPKLIKYSKDKKIIYSFLRGLADTDFSIKFKTRYNKKNYYPIIIGNLCDKTLVLQLKDILEGIGFHSHIENRTKYDKFVKKTYYSYALNIVGRENLTKWMDKIGFNNKRHLIRYSVWKTIGFCPPFTNIKKGEEIIKEHRGRIELPKRSSAGFRSTIVPPVLKDM